MKIAKNIQFVGLLSPKFLKQCSQYESEIKAFKNQFTNAKVRKCTHHCILLKLGEKLRSPLKIGKFLDNSLVEIFQLIQPGSNKHFYSIRLKKKIKHLTIPSSGAKHGFHHTQISPLITEHPVIH